MFFIPHIILENDTQVIIQKIIPQRAIERNELTQDIIVIQSTTVHSSIIPSIIRKRAKAVQSLNKLSHSNISANLLGAHIDLKIAKTATGSVADISTQKSKQTKKGISNQINGSIKNNEYQIINV